MGRKRQRSGGNDKEEEKKHVKQEQEQEQQQQQQQQQQQLELDRSVASLNSLLSSARMSRMSRMSSPRHRQIQTARKVPGLRVPRRQFAMKVVPRARRSDKPLITIPTDIPAAAAAVASSSSFQHPCLVIHRFTHGPDATYRFPSREQANAAILNQWDTYQSGEPLLSQCVLYQNADGYYRLRIVDDIKGFEDIYHAQAEEKATWKVMAKGQSMGNNPVEPEHDKKEDEDEDEDEDEEDDDEDEDEEDADDASRKEGEERAGGRRGKRGRYD